MNEAAPNLALLCWTAAAIAFGHTILGPDHYVPFVAMSRVGRWSFTRTLVTTALCGVGHVLSSVVLGLIGIFLGVAVFRLQSIEESRGSLAGWLLLAFGLVYTVWGIWRAVRNRPHTHLHVHVDGTVHNHQHAHVGEHLHVHGMQYAPTPAAGEGQPADVRAAASMTPWILFTIFVFGPCEPLIPLVMYPAARGSMSGVYLVTLVFSLVTIGTMVSVVTLFHLGLTRIRIAGLERYTHAAAGLTLLACGAAIQFGL